MIKRSFVREILEAARGDTISFAGGLPDEKLFPLEKLKLASQKAFERPNLLQYSVTGGILALRQKIADYYCSLGFDTKVENILITTGSQQALDLISRVYFKNGVIIESPSYLGAINTFTTNECPLTDIGLGDDGIDVAEFSDKFVKSKRAYLMCDFQNPTGQRYALEKRKKIAKEAVKSNGIIVEDGAYMELFFEERIECLSSFAPKNSLHLGSFSKILAPGLRIGWVRGDESLLRPLIALKERADLHTSTLTQAIADEFLAMDGFNTHLDHIRKTYSLKCDFLASELTDKIPSFTFEKPKGGMFIYGKFEGVKDSMELVRRCLAKGAVFVPGSEFYIGNPITGEARLNFTHTNSNEVAKGLQIIADELRY